MDYFDFTPLGDKLAQARLEEAKAVPVDYVPGLDGKVKLFIQRNWRTLVNDVDIYGLKNGDFIDGRFVKAVQLATGDKPPKGAVLTQIQKLFTKMGTHPFYVDFLMQRFEMLRLGKPGSTTRFDLPPLPNAPAPTTATPAPEIDATTDPGGDVAPLPVTQQADKLEPAETPDPEPEVIATPSPSNDVASTGAEGDAATADFDYMDHLVALKNYVDLVLDTKLPAWRDPAVRTKLDAGVLKAMVHGIQIENPEDASGHATTNMNLAKVLTGITNGFANPLSVVVFLGGLVPILRDYAAVSKAALGVPVVAPFTAKVSQMLLRAKDMINAVSKKMDQAKQPWPDSVVAPTPTNPPPVAQVPVLPPEPVPAPPAAPVDSDKLPLPPGALAKLAELEGAYKADYQDRMMKGLEPYPPSQDLLNLRVFMKTLSDTSGDLKFWNKGVTALENAVHPLIHAAETGEPVPADKDTVLSLLGSGYAEWIGSTLFELSSGAELRTRLKRKNPKNLPVKPSEYAALLGYFGHTLTHSSSGSGYWGSVIQNPLFPEAAKSTAKVMQERVKALADAAVAAASKAKEIKSFNATQAGSTAGGIANANKDKAPPSADGGVKPTPPHVDAPGIAPTPETTSSTQLPGSDAPLPVANAAAQAQQAAQIKADEKKKGVFDLYSVIEGAAGIEELLPTVDIKQFFFQPNPAKFQGFYGMPGSTGVFRVQGGAKSVVPPSSDLSSAQTKMFNEGVRAFLNNVISSYGEMDMGEISGKLAEIDAYGDQGFQVLAYLMFPNLAAFMQAYEKLKPAPKARVRSRVTSIFARAMRPLIKKFDPAVNVYVPPAVNKPAIADTPEATASVPAPGVDAPKPTSNVDNTWQADGAKPLPAMKSAVEIFAPEGKGPKAVAHPSIEALMPAIRLNGFRVEERDTEKHYPGNGVVSAQLVARINSQVPGYNDINPVSDQGPFAKSPHEAARYANNRDFLKRQAELFVKNAYASFTSVGFFKPFKDYLASPAVAAMGFTSPTLVADVSLDFQSIADFVATLWTLKPVERRGPESKLGAQLAALFTKGLQKLQQEPNPAVVADVAKAETASAADAEELAKAQAEYERVKQLIISPTANVVQAAERVAKATKLPQGYKGTLPPKVAQGLFTAYDTAQGFHGLLDSNQMLKALERAAPLMLPMYLRGLEAIRKSPYFLQASTWFGSPELSSIFMQAAQQWISSGILKTSLKDPALVNGLSGELGVPAANITKFFDSLSSVNSQIHALRFMVEGTKLGAQLPPLALLPKSTAWLADEASKIPDDKVQDARRVLAQRASISKDEASIASAMSSYPAELVRPLLPLLSDPMTGELGAAGAAAIGSLFIDYEEAISTALSDATTPDEEAQAAYWANYPAQGLADNFSDIIPHLLRADLTLEQQLYVRNVFAKHNKAQFQKGADPIPQASATTTPATGAASGDDASDLAPSTATAEGVAGKISAAQALPVDLANMLDSLGSLGDAGFVKMRANADKWESLVSAYVTPSASAEDDEPPSSMQYAMVFYGAVSLRAAYTLALKLQGSSKVQAMDALGKILLVQPALSARLGVNTADAKDNVWDVVRFIEKNNAPLSKAFVKAFINAKDYPLGIAYLPTPETVTPSPATSFDNPTPGAASSYSASQGAQSHLDEPWAPATLPASQQAKKDPLAQAAADLAAKIKTTAPSVPTSKANTGAPPPAPPQPVPTTASPVTPSTPLASPSGMKLKSIRWKPYVSPFGDPTFDVGFAQDGAAIPATALTKLANALSKKWLPDLKAALKQSGYSDLAPSDLDYADSVQLLIKVDPDDFPTAVIMGIGTATVQWLDDAQDFLEPFIATAIKEPVPTITQAQAPDPVAATPVVEPTLPTAAQLAQQVMGQAPAAPSPTMPQGSAPTKVSQAAEEAGVVVQEIAYRPKEDPEWDVTFDVKLHSASKGMSPEVATLQQQLALRFYKKLQQAFNASDYADEDAYPENALALDVKVSFLPSFNPFSATERDKARDAIAKEIDAFLTKYPAPTDPPQKMTK